MRQVAVLVLAVSLAGCALLQPPTVAGDRLDVRQTAVRAIRVAQAGVVIAHDASRLIAALPLDNAAKDQFDCAVLRVIGAQPSPTVTKVCGPVPTLEAAPLRLAVQQLGAVASCPSIRVIIGQVFAAVDPLLATLAGSKDASLMFAATALRATFEGLRPLLSGGTTCSL